jgi:hypothetical protein
MSSGVWRALKGFLVVGKGVSGGACEGAFLA